MLARSNHRTRTVVTVFCVLAAICVVVPAEGMASLRFVDRSQAAGLKHPTWCGRAEKPHILESGGTGVALFDYDADGDLDLYLVNGWRLEGSEIVERGRDRLYRNRGDGVFEDVTERAGLGHTGWGTGVAVGDIDGDGDLDLFVTNFGADVLYRNRGDGSFEPMADSPGIDGWSAAAVLFDADGDGDHDLYVGGYIDCSLEDVLGAEPRLEWQGFDVMLGPFGLEGLANRYFENLGSGRFRDATSEAGLEDAGLYYSFGIAAADLDADGRLDLYVANDSNPNYVYQNQGKGTFQEVGLWSGASLDREGMAQAGMGLAVADLDGDGLPELLVTNFYMDVSTLYQNQGDLIFEDITRSRGLHEPTYLPLSWGAAFSDFDQDGDLDLFVANGHIYPQADEAPPEARTSYAQTNLLLEQRPEGFTDVSEQSGPGLAVTASSRGLTAGDMDGDGDVDLAVTNCDLPPSLLRNETAAPGSWLLVDAPDAIRVEISVGDRRWVRHRVVGASYVSVSDSRFHFGLGEIERVDRLDVVRGSGARISLRQVPVNRALSFP